jgi:putative peptidoglycan lipid II flippase
MIFLPFQKATFPHFTRLIAEERYPELSRQIFQYVRFVVFLAVPAVVGMVLLGDLIVKLVYHRGAFGDRAVELTRYALTFYALGLPAAFVSRVFNNTFLSLKDTKTVMRMSLLRIGVKIVLAILLIPFLAHGGIALAESLSHYVRAGLYYFLLPAEVKGNEGWKTIKSFAGTSAATAVMAIAVYAARYGSVGHLHIMLQLAALVPIGALAYFATSWLSKQGELEWIGKNLVAMTRR